MNKIDTNACSHGAYILVRGKRQYTMNILNEYINMLNISNMKKSKVRQVKRDWMEYRGGGLQKACNLKQGSQGGLTEKVTCEKRLGVGKGMIYGKSIIGRGND